ncbi:MAG: hypothetical protein MJA29_06105, partial [Candidatus Omnitrophica bacterium]|nr:hypothetical protein [Candidatus Omnitrophota bacterium]
SNGRPRLPPFNEKEIDIEAYMANLNAVTTGWSSAEKLKLLREKLTGGAAKVLAALDIKGGSVSFEDVVAALERHYVGERSEWIAKLRDLRREQDESLDDLAFRISLYSKRAYGCLQTDLGLQLYLALRDGPLGDKLFECKDKPLEDVLQRAKSYESHLVAINQPIFDKTDVQKGVSAARGMQQTGEMQQNVQPAYGQYGSSGRGRGYYRGRGRGQYRGRGRGRRYGENDRRLDGRNCNVCGSPDHFWRECEVVAEHFAQQAGAAHQETPQQDGALNQVAVPPPQQMRGTAMNNQ